MRFNLITLVLVAALAGCKDREPLPTDVPDTRPEPAAASRVAYISVSELNPSVGSTVVVAGDVALGESASMASFRVRLGYDATALKFVDAVELPGMLRVVNPQGDEIIVAGASGGDSRDGRLFAVRFTVVDAAGLESLRLFVDELNDRNYASQLPSLTRSARLQLDRKLAPGVSPAR